ncbi:hypothetical protein [Flavobacterium sp.]|uniref:hypothetical protein n=1 Tax=Flavobacterium sp. TaxID=239 RepID=UPI0040347373
MEKITDYKLYDFLTLEDESIINDYLPILELLSPVTEILDPIHKSLGIVKVTPVRSLKFGEVFILRNLLTEGSGQSLIEAVGIVTKLPKETVLQFTIIPFYSIVNGIFTQLIEVDNMMQNELESEDEDIEMIEAQASERMSRFGIVNTIDNLAGGDILKWKAIQELPFMEVFTKLVMDKTKGDIMQDVRAIQERNRKNK